MVLVVVLASSAAGVLIIIAVVAAMVIIKYTRCRRKASDGMFNTVWLMLQLGQLKVSSSDAVTTVCILGILLDVNSFEVCYERLFSF